MQIHSTKTTLEQIRPGELYTVSPHAELAQELESAGHKSVALAIPVMLRLNPPIREALAAREMVVYRITVDAPELDDLVGCEACEKRFDPDAEEGSSMDAEGIWLCSACATEAVADYNADRKYEAGA